MRIFPVPVECGVGGARLAISNIELTDLNFLLEIIQIISGTSRISLP